MKKIAMLASNTGVSDSSNLEKMVDAVERGDLKAKVVCVLSDVDEGEVHTCAKSLGIHSAHFPAPWNWEHCHTLIGEDVDLVCLSEFQQLVVGFDPRTTINTHLGPLPQFGGEGMYGQHLQDMVMKACNSFDLRPPHSAVSMHFVTDAYNEGPVFFSLPVSIPCSVKALAIEVTKAAHEHQWQVIQQVLDGEICWDGKDPTSLVSPHIEKSKK